MLSLLKKDMSELVEAIAFRYDIVSDTLYLFGENKTFIPLRDKTEHFLADVQNGELLDEIFRDEILRLYKNSCANQSFFESKIQIKSINNKYGYYAIKGERREEEQIIHGILKKVNFEITVIEELERKAFMDPLTKIYNRNGLEEKLKLELKSFNNCYKGAMFLIDLDNFKTINDSMGHLLGDTLLIEIAEAIRSVFPQNAIISRIGGDEFLVFAYHESDVSIYEEKAKQLCEKVESLYNGHQEKYQMTLSVGVAVTDKEEEFNEIFNHADIALYKVKTGGKNGYLFYEDGMQFLPYINARSEEREFLADRIEDSGFNNLKFLVDRSIDIINENIEENIKWSVEQILLLLNEAFCANSVYMHCYNEELSKTGISICKLEEKLTIEPFKVDSTWEGFQKCFNTDGIFYCTNIDTLGQEIKGKIKEEKIESVLQVLIQRKGKTLGILGLNHCDERKIWTQSEINAIHTVGKIVSLLVYKVLKGNILKIKESN